MTTFNDVLRESAMIVSYHTTSWTAQAKDYAASLAAANAAGADAKAYSSYKNLMHGADTRLKAVRAVQAGVRAHHLRLTLPWGTTDADRGLRMLPVVNWQDYIKAIGKGQKEFKQTLQDFIDNYDADVAIAQAKLNIPNPPPGLYPRRDQLATMFSMHADFSPIPDGADFKGLPDLAKERLEQAYESKLVVKLGQALSACYDRVLEVLDTFVARASEGQPRASSWAQLAELPATIRAFNVVDDANAEAAAVLIQTRIASRFTADSLKDEADRELLRDAVQQAATDIRAMFNA